MNHGGGHLYVGDVFLSLTLFDSPIYKAYTKPAAPGEKGETWLSRGSSFPQEPQATLSPWCLCLQLPQKLHARAETPFPSLKQPFTGSLLPFSKGNAQRDPTNQFYQESIPEKLKLSVYCPPYPSFLLNTYGAGQIHTSNWFIPDRNTT